jgi:hypothetical protein
MNGNTQYSISANVLQDAIALAYRSLDHFFDNLTGSGLILGDSESSIYSRYGEVDVEYPSRSAILEEDFGSDYNSEVVRELFGAFSRGDFGNDTLIGSGEA